MDKRGVSVLVGFILLMLTLMIFLSILQAYMIPSMCKDAELKHLNKLVEDIQNLNKNIIDNKLTTVTLDLGISYPKYPMLLSPPMMSSSVRADKFKIYVSYDWILPNGSIERINLPLSSERLFIVPNYFYDRDEIILLENTAVLRLKKVNRNNTFLFALTDQQMFTQNGIRIPLINATFNSFSSSQPIDIAIVPISYGGYVIAKNVTVRFSTDCPEYWAKIADQLRSLGYNISVNRNTVTVSYNNSTKLSISYVVLYKGISTLATQYGQLAKNIESSLKKTIIPTNPTTNYTVLVNMSLTLGVEIIDEFNNPVVGYPVNVSLNGVGVVSPTRVFTDSKGYAEITFSSNTTGKASINFSTDFGHVIYTVTVISTGYQPTYPYAKIFDANIPNAVFAFGNEVNANPPSTNLTPSTPLPTENITKDDGIYLTSVALTDRYSAAQRFEIYGLSLNASETYVFWNGNGSSWWYDGETLYLWNYTSQRYDLIVYTDSANEIWLSVGLNASQMKNYIRGGKMIVLVVQKGYTRVWGRRTYYSKLSTDYVGVLQIFG